MSTGCSSLRGEDECTWRRSPRNPEHAHRTGGPEGLRRGRHRRPGRDDVVHEHDTKPGERDKALEDGPVSSLLPRPPGLRRPRIAPQEPLDTEARPSRDLARKERGLVEPALTRPARARRHPRDHVGLPADRHERGHARCERREASTGVAVLEAGDDRPRSPFVGEHCVERVERVRNGQGPCRRHEVGGTTRTDAPLGASAHRTTSGQEHARPIAGRRDARAINQSWAQSGRTPA